MNSVLYVYLPAQFIGYFVWQANMQKDSQGGGAVIAKSLTVKGWIVLLATISIGTLLLFKHLKQRAVVQPA
ncbi:nicotinamide mononucleotide transporter [Actinobacillus equuli]|nr:nicotinamide mononucleotide transporter [Actinobacillus equuli]